MLEATNVETARHWDDVVVLARAIAEQMGIEGAEKQDLLAAARLHDIGKTAVPLEVLEKPGPLNEQEWELMRQHTLIGHQILGSVAELAGIARLVRHSHERWDGDGYPDGLAGEDIPLGSRIIFCADAFHAIRSDRPYRAGRSPVESMAEVKRSAGTQFDPNVVDAFAKVARELRLAPSVTAFRRSSRLTALLLMLAIGTGGSAIASSGLLGEPSFASTPDAAGAPAASGSQMLGISFDDAIQVTRAPGAGWSALFGSGSAAGLRTSDRPGKGGSTIANPGEGSSRPAGSGDNSADDGNSSGGGSSGSSGSGNSGNSGSGHPQGGPPGQTGNHSQGGPPGQTGNQPQGGPPGQSGGSSDGGGSSGSSGSALRGDPPGQSKQ